MSANYFMVRNARGTSRRRACDCGTWIDHWYNETGSRRSTCAVLGCSDIATVGAHVVDVSRRGARPHHWIVPTCHHCNMTGDELAIKISVYLVSANTRLMGCYRR
jgi:hypothetical protein